MNELPPDFLDTEIPESAWSGSPSSLGVDTETSTPQAPVGAGRPWGPWATIGWTILCIVVLFVGQFVGAIVFLLAKAAASGSLNTDGLATNGNLLAVATFFSAPFAVGLVAFLVRVRRYPIRDYLALRWPAARSIVIALFGLVVVLVATDLTSYLIGRPLVPTVMVDAYRSAWLPALLFAMMVLAPLSEETLFRGFLYAGIAGSRAGPIVAILVSTVIFSSLHLQYDWYGVVGVAAIGLYLGVIRYWTGSLFLTMLLHAIGNGVATLELVVQDLWFK